MSNRNFIREKNKELIKDNKLWCPRCQQALSVESFGLNKSNFYGRSSECRACRVRYHDPVNRRLRHVKKAYNLSPTEYLTMVEESKGQCRICNQKKELVVDHCHSTGRVRGLICNHCNTVLGMAGDSVPILESAIKYLNAMD